MRGRPLLLAALALLLGAAPARRSNAKLVQYDAAVFHERGVGYLVASRRKPFVILNATDMTLGRRFGFTQEQFDLLCSDAARTKRAPASPRRRPSRDC